MSIERDPVCAMEATNSKITSTYQGKMYYFCSECCKISFELNPEKYLAKIKK
jgi:YHS domain-containing protein